ncbi:MAG TPA: TonB-dependent receptor [Bacteroidetes bacterium]|nr:TonB-dependent receptor [Bacteroidota bacterium]
MKRIYSSLIVLLMVFCAQAVFGQAKTVSGSVTDGDTGDALPGVTVLVKGTNTGTTTDVDGSFSLKVPSPESVLEFSYLGYVTQEMAVGDQQSFSIVLKPDFIGLEQVVVVGYGTQKKENLTGAVSVVDVAKTLESKPIADVARSLKGVVPGVTITHATGKLNQEPTIKLRGYGSVNGNSNPLILIDGVEGKLSDLNPEAIESISVLKDAASTSIYGTRAAFGVMLITTKQGRSGKAVLTYSNNFSFSKPIWDIKHAPMEFLMDAIHTAKERNNGGAPFAFGMGGQDWRDKSVQWEKDYGYLGSNLSDETMIEGRDFDVIDGQFYAYRSWDVFGQILNDNAFAQTHNISVSGGSDKLNYSVGFSTNAKEGLYKVNTETQTKNTLNANFSAKLNDWATLNFRNLYTKRIYEEPFSYRLGGRLGELFYALRWPNNFPYGISDGTYFGAPEGSSFIGPIGFLRNANRSRTERDYSRNTLETVLDILDQETQKLDFTANFSYSQTDQELHVKGGTVPLINWWSSGNPPQFDPFYYSTSTSRNKTSYDLTKVKLYTFNAFAKYTNTSVAGHTFSLLGGTNIEQNDYSFLTAGKPFLLDPNMPEIATATGDAFADNSKERWRVLGLFGRVNYNFNEKLLLELNGRLDGSSRFPAGDQFAFFPSGSIGYRLSEEDFAKDVLDMVKVSSLKLRGSWGQIGYQDIGQFVFIPTLSGRDANWIRNSQFEKTFRNPKAVSPSLTWETIETLDFGVDMGLFDNRVDISFDIFQRKNKDMLGPGQQLPAVLGASVPKVNAGEMTTKGWELTVNVRHRFNKDFDIYFTGVMSDAQAEITKWSNESGILSDFYEGMKLGDIWGFETDRLFQASDFGSNGDLNPDIPVQDPDIYSAGFNMGPGDVKYKDLNGDGVVNKGAFTKDDHGDLKIIGNTTPRYEYSIRTGLNFKWIDLGIFLQGVGKRQYWGTGNAALANFHYDVLYDYQTNYWREDNTDAFYPRPFASNVGSYLPNTKNIGRLLNGGNMLMYGKNNYVPQSKYLQDLSYLRLKEISLGFTVPASAIERYSIDRLRIYFAAYNIMEWTNSFTPIDPESTINYFGSLSFYGTQLPQSRSFSFGLQITL